MEGDRSVPELKGIIPNSFAHIFGHIAKADDHLKVCLLLILFVYVKLNLFISMKTCIVYV